MLLLEFSKDGPADLGHELTYGGSANQQVYVSPVARCLSVIASVKNFSWHPDKILVTWDICLCNVSQEVAVASLFLSLKDPGHDPGLFLLADGVIIRCWSQQSLRLV